MAETGVTFLLAVDEGGSVFNTLAGQRTTTMNRSTDEADSTTKDVADWHGSIPTIRNWTFDAEGILAEGDVAWVDLEDAWLANAKILIRLTQPNAKTWTGLCTVSTLNADGPHDDALTYSVSLTGDGVLTRV